MPNGSLVDHIAWKELNGKEARGVDKNVDLGEIQEIGSTYVVTQKGRISKDKFYIPKYLAQSYDGKKVWFNVTEGMLIEFKRESPPAAEEYTRYRRPDMPQDIEDQVIVATEVPIETEMTKKEEVEIIKEGTTPPATTIKTTTASDLRDTPVLNWDNTLHKNVRTTEGEPVGNVIALYPDSLHVESEGSHLKYEIPKSEVAGFNGAEVRLKAPVVDLERYITER